ncbi:MAG: hypothetical protein KAI38_03010, partial [Candidatus Latescibacteria bacterium]|nr:hypothetical protein [Candidatus Latescibacterota bacterium]
MGDIRFSAIILPRRSRRPLRKAVPNTPPIKKAGVNPALEKTKKHLKRLKLSPFRECPLFQ